MKNKYFTARIVSTRYLEKNKDKNNLRIESVTNIMFDDENGVASEIVDSFNKEDFNKACDEQQIIIAHKIMEKLNETTTRNNTLLTDSMHNNDNNSNSIA